MPEINLINEIRPFAYTVSTVMYIPLSLSFAQLTSTGDATVTAMQSRETALRSMLVCNSAAASQPAQTVESISKA